MSASAPDRPRSAGPNCYQCRHFAVSWDPKLPYQCQLMGFKSRALPALEVLRADGRFCTGFAAKPGTAAATTPAGAPASGPVRPPAGPADCNLRLSPEALAHERLPELPSLIKLRRVSALRKSA